MKEIFDWLREQISANKHSFGVKGLDGFHRVENVVSVVQLNRIINEAEAKREADCCEWKGYGGEVVIVSPHTGVMFDNFPRIKNVYCNTCGKRIKIREVE